MTDEKPSSAEKSKNPKELNKTVILDDEQLLDPSPTALLR
jgi:hypothetical protein